jgi:myo-inositol-1(or 4)-monophosphatase
MNYSDFAVDLARRAGAVLNCYASADKQVELKGRRDLVTVADKASEALIVTAIRSAYPEHRILAEESGAIESGDSGAGERRFRWIIDPLDGTTNYAHQYPMYSVSIALEVDGAVAAGAVFDPVRDEMFHSARGDGAYLNGQPIRISGVRALSGGLLLTGFPYDFPARLDEALGLFRQFMKRSQAVRRAGSAALDLCHLAMGRCDGFWELGLQPWDTAAGSLILEEAGGRVSRFDGGDFHLESGEILASNGRIHEEMIRAIREIGADESES